MDVRKIVGLNVKKARIGAGLTQEELAARMGVEQYYISGWEAGARNPTLLTIWRAAEALQVPPDELFHSAGHKPHIPRKKK